jgi:general stress protein 26
MNIDDLKKLRELLGNFSTAMLITRNAQDHLHARPMEMAKVDESGTVWFFSAEDSGKVHEIYHDTRVHLIFQSDHTLYIAVDGTASVSQDRQKIAELWKEPFRVWFPGGKDDPTISLIEVRPHSAEYWDSKGWNKVTYLLHAAQAYATGTTPEVKEGEQHGVLRS